MLDDIAFVWPDTTGRDVVKRLKALLRGQNIAVDDENIGVLDVQKVTPLPICFTLKFEPLNNFGVHLFRLTRGNNCWRGI